MPSTPTSTNEAAQAPTRRRQRLSRPHCPASVATTFQFGSREEISRAKVHTSVTSVTFSALPSITAPERSRVAETSFETKRTVICAALRLRSSAAVMVERVDRNKTRLGGFAAAFAFGDRGIETVKDFARQQIAQLAAVAAGKGRHDHLVSGARAGDEMLGVETRIRADDRIETRRDGRSALGNILPALGRRLRDFDRPRRRFGRSRRQRHDLVACRAAHGIARRIGIVGRPFAAGALAQDAAQPQENEDRKRQKDDGVDVEHVGHSFGSASGGTVCSKGGSNRPNRGRKPGSPALCRHAREAIQWPPIMTIACRRERLDDRRRRANNGSWLLQ